MRSLYEINNDIAQIIADGYTVDEETGEIIEDTDAKLDALNMERDAKIENIGLYIKHLNHMVDDIKAEEKALAERRKAKEAKIEHLQEYIVRALDATGSKRFETARIALSIRASEKVAIDENAVVPEEFLKEKTTVTPDKAEIKKALKAGRKFAGIHLEKCKNLQVK